MNILIIGEFSAFAKHLKNGFKQLGHYVTIVQNGDGWKAIKGDEDDIYYENKSLKLCGKRIPGSGRLFAMKQNRYIQAELDKRFKTKKIDLILIVNYTFLSSNLFSIGVSIEYVRKCIQNGSKLIMSICGHDIAQRLFGKPMPGWKQLNRKDKRYDFCLRNANKIIPTTYSYYYPIKKYCNQFGYDDSKINNAIPLPITIDQNCPINHLGKFKIVIFHGIIRPLVKGTHLIKIAMDKIQNEFPDKVECICKGGMPYDEYIKLFDRVDILIDQTYGNGWGMNAALGAMKAKCVLTSCGKENEINMNIPHIPFVQITPDSNQIYEVLKQLILNTSRIDELKAQSRKFIEEYCDCKIIANRYMDSVKLN